MAAIKMTRGLLTLTLDDETKREKMERAGWVVVADDKPASDSEQPKRRGRKPKADTTE